MDINRWQKNVNNNSGCDNSAIHSNAKGHRGLVSFKPKKDNLVNESSSCNERSVSVGKAANVGVR